MSGRLQNHTSPSGENLALLYQGLLTSIVRIQSGRQQIADSVVFRKQTKEVLGEIEREAVKLGYQQPDVSDTNYAIVAFLDEAVMNAADANRSSWVSLQTEMYGMAEAGVGFYDRVSELHRRGDSPQLADLMEVYYLCLLLGYVGRYAVTATNYQAELRQLMNTLRDRIESMRGPGTQLSPAAIPAASPAAPVIVPVETGIRNLRLATLASVAVVTLSWLIFFFLLGSNADQVRDFVQKSLYG